MPDNNEAKPDYVSKADLQVFLESFKQSFAQTLTDKEASFKKELETTSNKIHSSYANKLKKLGIDSDEEGDTTTSRKPTKRELELQDSIEKATKLLEKQALEKEETAKALTLEKQKGTFTKTLLDNGVNPKLVEDLYLLQNAKGNFVDDGAGGVKWKVNANGIDVALPLTDAIKHFVKSDVADAYLLPKGTGGTGGTPPNPTTASDKSGRVRPTVDVDWAKVTRDMKSGSDGGDGSFAPPFKQ